MSTDSTSLWFNHPNVTIGVAFGSIVVKSNENVDSKLREAAVALEATFLSEMLKSAGFGENHTQFSGGVGEENFQSFLRDAQARNIAENGGIGLAQALFEALKVRQDA